MEDDLVTRIYISYHSVDEMLEQQLEAQLVAAVEDLGDVRILASEHAVDAGGEIEKSRRTFVITSDLVLLLVSSDYLADQRSNNERKLALDVRPSSVICVLLRAVGHLPAELDRYQRLPRSGKPVQSAGKSFDETFAAIVKELRPIITRSVDAKNRRAKERAEARARADAEAKAEAEARARVDAEAKADAESRARAEAEAKADAAAQARAEAEAKADAAARARVDAEAKADAAARARIDAEAKADAAARARADAEAKADAESRARADAEAKAATEARARAVAEAKADAAARARADAEAKADAAARARADAEAKAALEIRARAEAEAKTALVMAQIEVERRSYADRTSHIDGPVRAEAHVSPASDALPKAGTSMEPSASDKAPDAASESLDAMSGEPDASSELSRTPPPVDAAARRHPAASPSKARSWVAWAVGAAALAVAVAGFAFARDDSGRDSSSPSTTGAATTTETTEIAATTTETTESDRRATSSQSATNARYHAEPRCPDAMVSIDVDGEILCFNEAEITVAEFLKCEESGGCPRAEDEYSRKNTGCNRYHVGGEDDRSRHPMNCVNQADAIGYCKSTYGEFRGEVPTKARWEAAVNGRRVGDALFFRPDLDATCWKRTTTCVVKASSAKTTTGLFDTVGNVAEWVVDTYENPSGMTMGRLCGRAFDETKRETLLGQCAGAYLSAGRADTLGFRCMAHPKID